MVIRPSPMQTVCRLLEESSLLAYLPALLLVFAFGAPVLAADQEKVDAKPKTELAPPEKAVTTRA